MKNHFLSIKDCIWISQNHFLWAIVKLWRKTSYSKMILVFSLMAIFLFVIPENSAMAKDKIAIKNLSLNDAKTDVVWNMESIDKPIPHPSAKDFPGFYRLKTKFRGEGECLEGNQAGSNAQGGNAFLNKCGNFQGQVWKIVPVGGGYYHLKNLFRGEGECLEGNEAGSNLHNGGAFMAACENDKGTFQGQLWKIVDAGGGYYFLKNKFRGDGECLEGNEAGSPAHGGNAFMNKCGNFQGQMWKLEKVADESTAANTNTPSQGQSNPTTGANNPTNNPSSGNTGTANTGPTGTGSTGTPNVNVTNTPSSTSGSGPDQVTITIDAPKGKTVIFEGKWTIQNNGSAIPSGSGQNTTAVTPPTPTPAPKPAYVPLPNPINLALNKKAVQSSANDHWFGDPAYAVDGNKKANFSTTKGQNSITHTNNDDNPWWEVDLGEIREISEVKIWNRLDGCCWDRLQNFYVMISENPITEISTTDHKFGSGPYSFTSQSEETKSITGKKMGRYVRIFMLSKGKPLSLTEVEVIGK